MRFQTGSDDTQSKGISGRVECHLKVEMVVHAHFLGASLLANTATASFQNPRSARTTRAWPVVQLCHAAQLVGVDKVDIHIFCVSQSRITVIRYNCLVIASPRPAVVSNGSGKGTWKRSRLLEFRKRCRAVISTSNGRTLVVAFVC